MTTQDNESKLKVIDSLISDSSSAAPASWNSKRKVLGLPLLLAAVLFSGFGLAMFTLDENGTAVRNPSLGSLKGKESPQFNIVSDEEKRQANRDETPLDAEPPANGYTAVLNASGFVVAQRMATVSSKIPGIIEAIEVDEGEQVKEGDILAKLESSAASRGVRLSEEKIGLRKAELESLIIAHRHAKKVHERYASLEKQGNLHSEVDLAEVETEMLQSAAIVETARANVKLAEIELEQQRLILDDHLILAPFAGVVAEKNAQSGELVSPTSAGGGFARTGICTLVDMGSLEVQVDISEASIKKVRPKQRAIVELDAYPDWQIPAEVLMIIPVADRSKATLRVRIKLLIQDDRIIPNLGARVLFLEMSGGTT